jgi:TolA-binding protein
VAVFALRRNALPSPTAFDGAIIESSASRELLRLADGSKIELQPNTRLQIGVSRHDAFQFELARGAVALDVAHVAGRSFVVAAAAYDVTIVGTKLSVELLEAQHRRHLRVSVNEGKVQLERRGQGAPRIIEHGESLTVPVESSPEAVSQVGTVQPVGDAEAEDAGPNAEQPAASEPLDPAAPTRAAPNAKDLFDRADKARLAGRVHECAEALDALRHRFRRDPRAGLAAFELGRLRLDSFGDPAGAAAAFADAIALSPGAPFGEDVRARLVQALEQSGQKARCLEAREAYLSRYPSGAYRAAITKRCNSL